MRGFVMTFSLSRLMISGKRLASLLVKELAARVLIVELLKVTEVFGLHAATDLQGEVIVHLEEHVGHVDVLVTVAPLVCDYTDHSWDELANIVGASLSEVGVDNSCCECNATEGQSQSLIAHHLLSAQVRLKVVIETMVSTMPVDVLFQVLFSEEIIRFIFLCKARHVVFTENIGADTS